MIGSTIAQTVARPAWPDRVTFDDQVGQLAQGTEKQIGRVRVQRTVREISIMERVLIGSKGPQGQQLPNWGKHVEDAPAARRAFVIWCFWEIRGRHTEVECQRRGWAYSTFRQRRDNAASAIASRLNQEDVKAW